MKKLLILIGLIVGAVTGRAQNVYGPQTIWGDLTINNWTSTVTVANITNISSGVGFTATGTWYYAVQASNQYGTARLGPVVTNTAATGKLTRIAWRPVAGYSGYRVWRGASPSGLTNYAVATGTNYTDYGTNTWQTGTATNTIISTNGLVFPDGSRLTSAAGAGAVNLAPLSNSVLAVGDVATNAQQTASNAVIRAGDTMSGILYGPGYTVSNVLYNNGSYWRNYLGIFGGRGVHGLLRNDSGAFQGLRILDDPSGTDGGVEIGPVITPTEVLWGGFVRTRTFVAAGAWPGATNVAVSLGFYPFAVGATSAPNDVLSVTTNGVTVAPSYRYYGDGAGLTNLPVQGLRLTNEWAAGLVVTSGDGTNFGWTAIVVTPSITNETDPIATNWIAVNGVTFTSNNTYAAGTTQRFDLVLATNTRALFGGYATRTNNATGSFNFSTNGHITAANSFMAAIGSEVSGNHRISSANNAMIAARGVARYCDITSSGGGNIIIGSDFGTISGSTSAGALVGTHGATISGSGFGNIIAGTYYAGAAIEGSGNALLGVGTAGNYVAALNSSTYGTAAHGSLMGGLFLSASATTLNGYGSVMLGGAEGSKLVGDYSMTLMSGASTNQGARQLVIGPSVVASNGYNMTVNLSAGSVVVNTNRSSVMLYATNGVLINTASAAGFALDVGGAIRTTAVGSGVLTAGVCIVTFPLTMPTTNYVLLATYADGGTATNALAVDRAGRTRTNCVVRGDSTNAFDYVLMGRP